MDDDIYKQLDRETDKLETFRKEEYSLRKKYEAARHLRDCQEEEVSRLFRHAIEKARS